LSFEGESWGGCSLAAASGFVAFSSVGFG